MPDSPSTCWTMIRDASGGDATARERFASMYAPVIRAYLGARWGGGPLREVIEDAQQDVFIELFRDGGALGKLDEQSESGFRGFLFGVTRNVARRHEQKKQRSRSDQPATAFFDHLPDDEPRLSQIFDQAWAKSLLHEAGRVQHEKAAELGSEAIRRHDLLQLRFRDGLPIRDIAARWDEPAEHVHREYAKARREFQEALLEVIRFHHENASEERLAQIAKDLIGLLAL
ncbi:MAG: sigma-70 family RNA polymerase sigma factor [Planctomycetota bacterium]|nr:sigma-70 family RNA polymerase sigma factor [Planctomycetota bacterium]